MGKKSGQWLQLSFAIMSICYVYSTVSISGDSTKNNMVGEHAHKNSPQKHKHLKIYVQFSIEGAKNHQKDQEDNVKRQDAPSTMNNDALNAMKNSWRNKMWARMRSKRGSKHCRHHAKKKLHTIPSNKKNFLKSSVVRMG